MDSDQQSWRINKSLVDIKADLKILRIRLLDSHPAFDQFDRVLMHIILKKTKETFISKSCLICCFLIDYDCVFISNSVFPSILKKFLLLRYNE